MCIKKRFATRAAALLRIAEIKSRGEARERQPIREYYCGECGGHHLTSQAMSSKKKKLLINRKMLRPAKIAAQWVKKKGWDL